MQRRVSHAFLRGRPELDDELLALAQLPHKALRIRQRCKSYQQRKGDQTQLQVYRDAVRPHVGAVVCASVVKSAQLHRRWSARALVPSKSSAPARRSIRSEEHTSELQSRGHLVCRLLLEKNKDNIRL